MQKQGKIYDLGFMIGVPGFRILNSPPGFEGTKQHEECS